MKIYGVQDLEAQKKIPLISTSYIYTGEQTDIYTPGETYFVVTAAYHWEKNWGFGLYVTHDRYADYPYPAPTSFFKYDVDYCCFWGVDDFLNSFWQA